ncbi:MAG: glycosyltransferase family 87 protein [Candidatus Omnitrophota bacterium]
MLRRILTSNYFFAATAAIFIISLACATVAREGKDLKVGLFGVEQVLNKKSPYDNPTNPSRPLFRYAPAFTILQYPYLLKSEMTAPFEFKKIAPSVIAWYLTVILCLFISAWLLPKIIPAADDKAAFENLKISFLLSLPAIGYELSNGQNKLFALCLMLIAVYLFERKKMFFSSIFFNLALTVYIPLVFFVLYFILKSKGKYIISFITGVFLVFILLPSLVLGLNFNLFLLKEWFMRCLKPFFLTNTYATYIDLRSSSQSLPSAIGRIFVSGHTGSFNYRISPVLIHLIIRFTTTAILLASCWATWKNSKAECRGLQYAIFLILALILPAYCIYYTWGWLFVVYFSAFNYMTFRENSEKTKKLLLFLVPILVIASCLFSLRPFNHLSLLCWTTLLFWGGLVSVILRNNRRPVLIKKIP